MVVAYTAPISAGAAYLIFGNATLGKTDAGAPLVHCHAAFCDETGAPLGGHIVPQTTIVGERPVPVLVTSLEGFELRATYDAETNLRLLQPQGTVTMDMPDVESGSMGRVAYARIGPNEDLVQGVEKLCWPRAFAMPSCAARWAAWWMPACTPAMADTAMCPGRRSRSSVSPARCGRSRTAR